MISKLVLSMSFFLFLSCEKPQGDLTQNFSQSEFACHHCGEVTLNWKLILSLQQLRNRIGQPIYVTSGFRCAIHNRNVGGAPHSLHLQGMAADIRVVGMSVSELANHAREIPFLRGVGVYPSRGFVHVDVRGTPLRWIRL